MQEQSVKKEAQAIVKSFMWKIRVVQIAAVILVALVGWTLVSLDVRQGSNNFISFFLILLVVIMAVRLHLLSQFKLIDKVLTEECDPQKFTAIYKIFIDKSYFRNWHIQFSLNIVTGLLNSGDYNQAYAVLKTIDIQGKAIPLTLQYYYLLANCYAIQKDFVQVEQVLEKLKQISLKVEPSYKNSTYAKESIQLIKGLLAENNKEYELAFEICTLFLKNAKVLIQKVVSTYKLAYLYFLKEDYLNSKNNCEYVIKYGNKLFHVAKAKELLDRCDK